MMTLTADGIIQAAAVLGALGVFWKMWKSVDRFVARQKDQDKELVEIRADHKESIDKINQSIATSIANVTKTNDKNLSEIREELTLITYAQLACLKGLKEQGCNGPVTEALNKLEKHLNQAAHHQDNKVV